VLEDDYDSEFRYAGRPLEALQGLDRAGVVAYVGSCSKVLLPPLRLGYVVAPPPLVRPLVAAKWLADRQTPGLEQQVLADFLAEGHFERHLRRTRRRYAARRDALLAALRERLGGQVRVSGSGGGLHLVAWLERLGTRPARPEDEEAVARAAAELGVGVYPIGACYAGQERRPALLLGFAGLTEAEIQAGVQLLAAAVERVAAGRG
jgi:GntR family transcriptional regulator/MocR family aminotransferase